MTSNFKFCSSRSVGKLPGPLLALTLLTALSPAVGSAEEIKFDAAGVTVRSASGYRGAVTTRQPPQGAFLYGIEANEKGDSPCFMKFHWWRKPGSGAPETLTTEFKTPECPANMKGDKEAIYANAANQRVAVASLSVCNNGQSNHRLKGVELESRKLEDGVLRSGTQEKYSRTNCKDWQTASVCPAGQWAVGVDIHTQADSITGLALRCARPIVEDVVVRSETLSLKPATKTAKLTGKKASVIYSHWGDSKFRTLFQESQINLANVIEPYHRSILLSHDSMPDWMDGNGKARQLASEVKAPTLQNLAATLESLADQGYTIDLFVFSHGRPEEFVGTNGAYSNPVDMVSSEIRKLAQSGSSYTGYASLPIRIVYQMNCYGSTMNDDWRAIGATAAMGSKWINFKINTFNSFAKAWTGGSTFREAIAELDSKSAWTVVDLLILADALDTRNDGLRDHGRSWSGCPALPVPQTVLGKHSCAQDYFVARWSETPNEWVNGENGKNFMRLSSTVLTSGNTSIRF
jgi:hypothetical protein